MNIDVAEVSAMQAELNKQKNESPVINRGLASKEKTNRNKQLEKLSPIRAAELKTDLEKKFNWFPFEVKPSVVLINNAQSLVGSIETSTDPRAVEIMEPMTSWIDLDEPLPDDRELSEEVKRAVGVFALRQTLKIITESGGSVEPSGTAAQYLDAIRIAKEDQTLIDELATKLPILTKPSREVMQIDEKWIDQDKTLDTIRSQSETLGTFKLRSMIPNLKRGADYSRMWDREGLTSENIPRADLTVGQIMTLARFEGWLYLADDSDEDWIDQAGLWAIDKEKIIGLAQNLPQYDRERVKAELNVIENALFE